MKTITEFLYNKHAKNVSDSLVKELLEEFFHELNLSLPKDTSFYYTIKDFSGKYINISLTKQQWDTCVVIAQQHINDKNIYIEAGEDDDLIVVEDTKLTDLWFRVEYKSAYLKKHPTQFRISNELYNRIIS